MLGRRGYQVRDATRVAGGTRALEVDEIRHGSKQLVDLVTVESAAAIWRLRQRRGPGIHFEHSVHDCGGITLEHLGYGRAELRATPGSDHLNGLLEATCPQMHL